MPTGYTAPIYDGEKDFTFEKFVMRCARSRGALLEMRGEPLDAKIDFDKLFQPSDYHKRALERAEKEYQDFLDNPPTEEELGKQYDERDRKDNEWYLMEVDRRGVIRVRYEQMLQKVKQWMPPTDEHCSLKDFMIEQLESSMNYDCDVHPPIHGSREEHIKFYSSPDYLLREIEHHREEYEKEVEYCNKKKQWVIDLINSLKEG